MQVTFVTMMLCCNRLHHNHQAKAFNAVDSIIDIDARQAVLLLDSLKGECDNEYARFKWQLLYVKANDKADMPITKYDTFMDSIIQYFEQEELTEDIIEAYYYLGRIKTEKHCASQAFAAFLHASELSKEHSYANPRICGRCYSSMSYLLVRQGNFTMALPTAIDGYNLANRFHFLDPWYIMDVSQAYRYLAQMDSVETYNKRALECLLGKEWEASYWDIVGEMLDYYSTEHNRIMADSCMSLLNRIRVAERPHNYVGSKAVYFENFGPVDSLIYYDAIHVADGVEPLLKRDAARSLMNAYGQLGDYSKAYEYGVIYENASDSLEKQLQQENTMNVYIEHQQRLKSEAENIASKNAYEAKVYSILAVSSAIIILLLSALTYFIYQLRIKQKLITMERITQEAIESRNKLTDYMLNTSMSGDLAKLIAKFKQPKNRSDLSISEEDWSHLLNNQNEPVPTFISEVYRLWPDISQRNLRVALLMKLGVSSSNIAQAVNLSRSYIYRIQEEVMIHLSSIL